MLRVHSCTCTLRCLHSAQDLLVHLHAQDKAPLERMSRTLVSRNLRAALYLPGGPACALGIQMAQAALVGSLGGRTRYAVIQNGTHLDALVQRCVAEGGEQLLPAVRERIMTVVPREY